MLFYKDLTVGFAMDSFDKFHCILIVSWGLVSKPGWATSLRESGKNRHLPLTLRNYLKRRRT